MLSDFESDLTSLSSSEEEYVPISRKRKTKAKPEYRISNPLRPPRTTSYTAKSLYDQITDNNIDLDPAYQREVVWPETKQIGLIDSILRNYYIPPIIFAVSTAEDGTETRTCIDGKQRLTSIQKFMDGLICHKDSFTSQRFWYKQGGGARRPMLPRQYSAAFANKQITCVEYDSLTGDQEREIFQRVQLGVALTPAERMQALTGPFPSLIHDIQSRLFMGPDGIGDHLDWDRARGRDFQCLASIVYLIKHYPIGKFPAAPQLDKWLQSSETVSSKLREELMETFDIFVALVKDKRYNAPFHSPTKLSPVEFTMTGVLIYCHRATLSMMQLSSAIAEMRKDCRQHHVDVRSNAKVTRTMWTFITKGVNKASLKKERANDSPAVTVIQSLTTSSSSKARKRKRVLFSDDEDEEDDKRLPAKAPTPRSTSSLKASETAKLQSKSASKTTTSKTSIKTTSEGKTTAASSKITVKKTSGTSVVVKSVGRPKASASQTATRRGSRGAASSSNAPATTKQIQESSLSSIPRVSPANHVEWSQNEKPVAPSPPKPTERKSSTPVRNAGAPVVLPRGIKSTSRTPSRAPSEVKAPLVSTSSLSVPPPVKSEPSPPPGPSGSAAKLVGGSGVVNRLAPIRAARALSGVIPMQETGSPGPTPSQSVSPAQPSPTVANHRAYLQQHSLPPIITKPNEGSLQVDPVNSPAVASQPTSGTQTISQAALEALLVQHNLSKPTQSPIIPAAASPAISGVKSGSVTADPRLIGRNPASTASTPTVEFASPSITINAASAVQISSQTNPPLQSPSMPQSPNVLQNVAPLMRLQSSAQIHSNGSNLPNSGTGQSQMPPPSTGPLGQPSTPILPSSNSSQTALGNVPSGSSGSIMDGRSVSPTTSLKSPSLPNRPPPSGPRRLSSPTSSHRSWEGDRHRSLSRTRSWDRGRGRARGYSGSDYGRDRDSSRERDRDRSRERDRDWGGRGRGRRRDWGEQRGFRGRRDDGRRKPYSRFD